MSNCILNTVAQQSLYESAAKPWRLSIAPMLDVSDRHARFFYRLLAPKALLYTEMVTTGALVYGDVARHLQFNQEEHPVALQLGGSERTDLVHSAKLGAAWGYDEINLNCGCPSERVQKGAFGACLMAESELVADCLKAMQDAVSIPVTVKHRLGLDYSEDYGFVRDFVGTLIQKSATRVFIVHARNAVLKGLSPKDNRDIPPLRYQWVAQLKQDFPEARFILNGGLSEVAQMFEQAQRFEGIMVGRAAWHEPYRIGEISRLLWPDIDHPDTDSLIQSMYDYAVRQHAAGVPLRFVFKPLLGLFNGQKGAKLWRRTLSDASLLKKADPNLLLKTYAEFKKHSSFFAQT
ncbi:tRNA dihydrouridine(20/20a) synthase DusA [Oligella urethralis]|nr:MULTISPECIES: tRNA dihydrouridine(20/20a) synthase DusA [Oligella]MDK6202076.1 tRNA dihydrouridine(20/20a) synthase DusA [Oligella urethralis]